MPTEPAGNVVEAAPPVVQLLVFPAVFAQFQLSPVFVFEKQIVFLSLLSSFDNVNLSPLFASQKQSGKVPVKSAVDTTVLVLEVDVKAQVFVSTEKAFVFCLFINVEKIVNIKIKNNILENDF